MTGKTAQDIAALQRHLEDNGGLAYVDFQEADAVNAALQRWPLLRRLMQGTTPEPAGGTNNDPAA